MKCNSCGYENNTDDLEVKYCCNCGKELNSDVIDLDTTEKPVPKCFDVFAKIGFYVGLFSLIGCIFFGMGFAFSEIGIVFSALGKRSKINKKYADRGLVLSILALILGVIIYVICCVLFVLLMVYLTFPRFE